MSACRDRLTSRLSRRVLILAPTGVEFLEAGADILAVETAGAAAQRSSAPSTDPSASQSAGRAARTARAAADTFTERDPAHPRFVAGMLDAGTCEADLRNLAAALLDGGIDLLWLEVGGDIPVAKLALLEVRQLLAQHGGDVPLCLSVRRSEAFASDAGAVRAQTGAPRTAPLPLDALWTALRHAEPLCFGLDATLIDDQTEAELAALSAGIDSHLALLAGTAHLDLRGDTAHVDRLANLLRQAERSAECSAVNILGIRRGATPEQIARLVEGAGHAAPRPVPRSASSCRLSGREVLTIHAGGPFVKIGERANVAGSAGFAGLIREHRHADALEVVRRQIGQGARIIDLNFDDPKLDGPTEMAAFVSLIGADPEASRVPLMIDSADWRVLEAGLRALPGRGIINSISLKDGDEELLRRARTIRELGAVPVLVALDEQGPAEDAARKVEICIRGLRLATERAGLAPHEIILDPVILAVGTGLPEHGGTAVAYLTACRMLREAFPETPISGGVSNLSFAFRGSQTIRAAMHSVFLHHAIPAGMTMGIVNVARWQAYADLPEELREAAEDVVLDRRPDAPIRLARLARRLRAAGRGPADQVQEA